MLSRFELALLSFAPVDGDDGVLQCLHQCLKQIAATKRVSPTLGKSEVLQRGGKEWAGSALIGDHAGTLRVESNGYVLFIPVQYPDFHITKALAGYPPMHVVPVNPMYLYSGTRRPHQ